MDLHYYHSLDLVVTLCDWIYSAIGIYHWTLKNYIIWRRWLDLVWDKQALYLDDCWLELLIAYHRSMHKFHYLENIQHYWLDKLLYLVILIDDISSWVRVSSFWTNIMSDQVIIELLSFTLRCSLEWLDDYCSDILPGMNNVLISSFIHTEVASRDWTHVAWWSSYNITVMEQYYISLPTMCSDIADVYWSHKQWSLSTIIVPAYIYSNIPGCYHFSSIYVHRPDVHRSTKSSAVGLVALRCQQCSSFVYDSSVFNVFWCFHQLMLVKHYPSSTYIPDLCSSFCWSLRIAPCSDYVFVRIAPLQCSQIYNNISTFVRLHSCVLVISLL